MVRSQLRNLGRITYYKSILFNLKIKVKHSNGKLQTLVRYKKKQNNFAGQSYQPDKARLLVGLYTYICMCINKKTAQFFRYKFYNLKFI